MVLVIGKNDLMTYEVYGPFNTWEEASSFHVHTHWAENQVQELRDPMRILSNMKK